MRIVYYSLAQSPGSNCEQQWIQSIRSLRRFNWDTPVYLVVYGGLSEWIAQEAYHSNVTLVLLQEYSTYLERVSHHGPILAHYPTFHKFLSLDHLPTDEASQILFLDCDTFFFDDVEKLFDIYGERDWYAREEPLSRRSHFGYDSSCVDESILKSIAEREGLQLMVPFNTGVCLLNNGIWNPVKELRATYLDLAWRLLVGRQIGGVDESAFESDVRAGVMATATGDDFLRALEYPSNNHWIIDEIALWLTLACIPDLSIGLFSRDHVAQGGEYDGGEQACVVAHYFSNLEAEFFSKVQTVCD